MADLLTDSIESFMLTLEKERNFSLHTIKAYKNDLNRFNYFLDNTLSRKKLAKINRNDIRKFLAEEYDNGYSSKTVARRLATIKSYFKYLVKTELIQENISIHINSPKVPKKLPNFVDKNLIDTLMKTPSLDTHIGIRDRAVLELFYSTGMRLSELVNMNIGDFEINKKLIRVIGKGNKERMIPYGRAAESAIKNYLKIRNLSLKPSFANKPLFVNSSEKRISKRTIQRRMNNYIKLSKDNDRHGKSKVEIYWDSMSKKEMKTVLEAAKAVGRDCLLYTSPSPRDRG